MYSMNLFNVSAASRRHRLYPGPEMPAGLRHPVPVQAAHHLLDPLHQRAGIPVSSSVDLHLDSGPHKIAEGIAVGGEGRPDLLLPELWQVLPAPVLRPLALVYRIRVLLEDKMASPGHLVHPGLHNIRKHLNSGWWGPDQDLLAGSGNGLTGFRSYPG